MFAQSFFHGTKAAFAPGDLIAVGYRSNFTDAKSLSGVFLQARRCGDLGAELAGGSGTERIYVVEPTSAIEEDPNLTDKEFPGTPTLSYRPAIHCA